MNLQRFVHTREQHKIVEDRRPVYKIPLWYLGASLVGCLLVVLTFVLAGLFLYLFSQLAGQPLALGTYSYFVHIAAYFVSHFCVQPSSLPPSSRLSDR